MIHETAARAALKALIKKVGGPRRLAEALACSRQNVESWELIPLVYIRKTHALYGQGLAELRPDIQALANLPRKPSQES
jgi:hypothetical protein